MIALFKKILGVVLPRPLVEKLRYQARIKSNFQYEVDRFRQWSALNTTAIGQAQKKAQIVKDYHRLEKGMALGKPKKPFGQQVAKDLMNYISDYCVSYPVDRDVQIALDVLTAYTRFHRDVGYPLNDMEDDLKKLRERNLGVCSDELKGGYITFSKGEVLSKEKLDLKDFFDYRFSIRHFSDQEVSVDVIKSAISMARKTPSVCNRQAAKAHLFVNKEQMKRILQFQNGNTGFTDEINKLIVVTTDLRFFLNVGERYQYWIDGGMFAMSLIYALHSLGLGTCCLNWSVEYEVDQAVRKELNIPDHESIIMFIAVGHLPDKFKVAHSKRREIDDFLEVHK